MGRITVHKTGEAIPAGPVDLCVLLRKAGYPVEKLPWQGDPAYRRLPPIPARCGQGSLFVAVTGSRWMAIAYLERGLGWREQRSGGSGQDKTCRRRSRRAVIAVSDSHAALGRLAAAFYDNPASRLVLIGITGTNGKTTTSYLVEALLRAAGFEPGVLGTVNYRYAGRIVTGSPHHSRARGTASPAAADGGQRRNPCGHGSFLPCLAAGQAGRPAV